MRKIAASVTKLIVTAVVMAVLLTSCVAYNADQLRRADMRGFTKEIDEPSARGLLKRVSPEESFVTSRFCFSPDGQHIIYSGYHGTGPNQIAQLWRIPQEGSGSPTKLTSGGNEDISSPTFTSDGKWIVYSAAGKIWQVNEDGAGGKKRIPGSGGWDYDPALSKFDRLVFCSWQSPTGQNPGRGTSLIWTSNLDGSDLTQIREGENPQWSPDGKQIIFSYMGDIWQIDADGRNLIQLTSTSDIYEGLPSYSDDGSLIVYASNESKQHERSTQQAYRDFNIWVMEPNGRNKYQITELNSWDSWPAMHNNQI